MFLDSLEVLGDFLVLTHTLVSLPVISCHFLYHSLGKGESRYCWWKLWACVEMLILIRNVHCSILYVLQLNKFLWLITSKYAVIDQNKLIYNSVSVTGDCLCHCTRWCLLTAKKFTHWCQVTTSIKFQHSTVKSVVPKCAVHSPFATQRVSGIFCNDEFYFHRIPE